ncbi:hypothetical protein E2C01_019062 [Portunus trituberculatus]|uniref:Uncharacterized protein n=1 Tax=Portunus trituberculatus TaxID=210409 RepID=A0A5B7DWW9_PORTR|nr:hypothetical protein [Portunus trituberculatus]
MLQKSVLQSPSRAESAWRRDEGTVINHDSEHQGSYMSSSSGAAAVVGRLSRQGSSVESSHSATVHVHTPECCIRTRPSGLPGSSLLPTCSIKL